VALRLDRRCDFFKTSIGHAQVRSIGGRCDNFTRNISSGGLNAALSVVFQRIFSGRRDKIALNAASETCHDYLPAAE